MYMFMMGKQYSIADARRQLPSLITQAESGSSVELTRRGRPVAVLISVDEYDRLKRGGLEFREAYSAFLERFRLQDVGVELDWAEKLRDSTTGRPVDL
jgi:prevent-host-death family protein